MISTERRQFKRIPVPCTVNYYHLAPSPNPPVFHAINLSLGGACIEAPEPHVPGAVLAFYLITPSRRATDVRAKVIYFRAAQPELYYVGVRFTNLSPQDRTILAREIEHASA